MVLFSILPLYWPDLFAPCWFSSWSSPVTELLNKTIDCRILDRFPSWAESSQEMVSVSTWAPEIFWAKGEKKCNLRCHPQPHSIPRSQMFSWSSKIQNCYEVVGHWETPAGDRSLRLSDSAYLRPFCSFIHISPQSLSSDWWHFPLSCKSFLFIKMLLA